MQEIAVYDLDGNTLTNLVQYDTDVYIHIKDSRITAAYQVQFFNSTSESALVMNSTYNNGILSVKIPNDLLLQPYTITGYVNVKKSGESKCLYGFRIAVRKKPQPNDWVHVDSKDYVTFEQIVEECREFAKNASTSATNAKASEIAASNSATNAKNSENNAANSAAAALVSENNAKASEKNAAQSELNAKESEKATDRNVELTKEYAHAAEISEENALDSEKKANEHAAISMSYAIGGGSDFLLDSDGNIISTSEDGSQIYMSFVREGEATDNAKYYYEQAKAHAQDAGNSKDIAVTSATNAKNSENNAANSAAAALVSENNAKASELASATSETNSKASETNAKTSEQNAKTSEVNAKTSEQNAKLYTDNAKASETNSKVSETNAKDSEDNAAISESKAKTSETNAKDSADSASADASRAETARVDVEKYANLSQSYAVGTENTVRQNDKTDNAKYYYEQSKQISAGLSGALLPMGTIVFADLSIQTKMSGYMFNISDSFVTDATFKDGAGVKYPAGTNVYYTADGYWDCLAGTLVTGVKGNKETTYRVGDVNLTPEDIGAQSVESAATMQSEIDNITSDISSIQTDISTIHTDVDNIKNDMDTYVKGLLDTVSALQDTVSFLEDMIYTGKVMSFLIDSDGDDIVTSDGVNLCAWWNL